MLDTIPPGGHPGRSRVAERPEGGYAAFVGTAEFGNGTTTVHRQIVADALGCAPGDVVVFSSDTDRSGHDTGAFGSTGIAVAGTATMRAARALADAIAARTASGDADGGKPLEAEGYCDGRSRSVSFTVQGFRVAVCADTGEIRVLQSVQAVDAGTVLNPVQLRGQVEGGVAQALGAALFEEVRLDPGGRVTTRALREYHVPVLADVPPTEVLFASTFDPFGPYGAKPMSEAPFNPVAPALANAVRDATGVRLTALAAAEGPRVRATTHPGGVTMVQVGDNRYGKAEIRVVRVARGAAHDGSDVIRDWNVSTSLSGDLDGTHLTGDNSNVLPTDSQKNRVYALAKELGAVEPETFALELASFFVSSQQPITRARICVEEYGWTPIGATGYSFARAGDLVRTTTVVRDAVAGTSVVSGIKDLIVMNTTASEFWGFPRDAHTTLAETKDRILATAVNARWRFRPEAVATADWAAVASTAKQTILGTFAGTYSYSLQQMLYALGSGLLAAVPELCEVRLALPNKHHFIVDLAPFGLENEREVYHADDRPYGLIEGSVLADDAPEAGLAWD